MSWTVLLWRESEKVLRRILVLFSIMVLKVSEVSTAALDIHVDAMIPNANTARRLGFASELNINCVVVRAPTPKGPIYILTASSLSKTNPEWDYFGEISYHSVTYVTVETMKCELLIPSSNKQRICAVCMVYGKELHR